MKIKVLKGGIRQEEPKTFLPETNNTTVVAVRRDLMAELIQSKLDRQMSPEEVQCRNYLLFGKANE